MSIEPTKLKPNLHQSYSNGFFLLRMPLIINGQPAEINYNDKGMLALNCRYPSLSITFDALFNDVSTVVKEYGLAGITNYWCEDVPLFQLKLSTLDGMKKFISTAEAVQNELASKISAQLSEQQRIFCPSTSQSNLLVIVHTEVFLVTPDPISKDAVLRVMTAEPENLSACLSLWRESIVFDFGALFRAYRTRHEKDCGLPTLYQLLSDLNDVVEWFLLGIYLDIPESDLEKIKYENQWNVSDCKREMLSTWLRRNPQPTWATIVNTLTDIGRMSLAYKIALKYGIPTPSLKAKRFPTRKNRDPVQQKICNQVEEIRSGIVSKDMELMVKKQTLNGAQNARTLAWQKFERMKHDAVEVQTRVTKLIAKKAEMLKLLEQKEHRLRTLQKIHEREKGELQSLIDEKNDEIARLKQELAAVQAELATEKQKASALQKQLQQATEDLAGNYARVQELQWVQQKLETFLDSERKRVDQLLMQQIAVSHSQQQYTKEIESQLSTAKQESEAKATEMEALKQIVAYKEEEVKGLYTQLKSQEALLQRLLTQPQLVTRPDPTQDLEMEEELKRLTVEVAELRARLVEAEDVKQGAQRQMEVAQLESRLLWEFTTELRAVRQLSTDKPEPTVRQPHTDLPKPAVRQPLADLPKPAVRQPLADLPKPAVWQPLADLPKPAVRQPLADLPKPAVRQPLADLPKPAVRQPLADLPKPAVRQLHTDMSEPTVRQPLITVEQVVRQSPTDTPKPVVSLYPGAPLKWERLASLPIRMRHAQATVVGNKVYVGGGVTPSIAQDCNIYVYEFTGDVAWKTLTHSTAYPALTTYQDRLVLVGGEYPSTDMPTNELWVMEDEQTWIQPIPPMPTPRSKASAVSTQQYLVTAGGSQNACDVNVVEIFNGNQWVHTDPLPKCCYFMKSALHDGFLYLMGGFYMSTSLVFQCSLQSLFLRTPKKQSLWNSIQDAPYCYSSVNTFGGALVAVGGGKQKSLHMYDHLTQSWVHAGELPEAVDCTCTVTLPSGEMLVIGGWTGVAHYSTLVYKASLEM